VEADTTAHSVTASLEQMVTLRDSGVSSDELEAVRESDTVGLPVSYSTARSMASALVDMVVHDLPDDFVDQHGAWYQPLTYQSLKRAAAEDLLAEEAIVVVVGDAERLRGQLIAAELGTVAVRDPETRWDRGAPAGADIPEHVRPDVL